MQADFLSSEVVKQQAVVAGFANVEDYVVSLLHRDRERHAIKKGLDEIEAGLAVPFEEFDREFRDQHSIDVQL